MNEYFNITKNMGGITYPRHTVRYAMLSAEPTADIFQYQATYAQYINLSRICWLIYNPAERHSVVDQFQHLSPPKGMCGFIASLLLLRLPLATVDILVNNSAFHYQISHMILACKQYYVYVMHMSLFYISLLWFYVM